jgi:hypothetical protein
MQLSRTAPEQADSKPLPEAVSALSKGSSSTRAAILKMQFAAAQASWSAVMAHVHAGSPAVI